MRKEKSKVCMKYYNHINKRNNQKENQFILPQNIVKAFTKLTD